MDFGVFAVHGVKVGCKQRRLVTAGAGAYLQDGILRVGLVLGNQKEPHRLLSLRQLFLQLSELFLRQFLHFRI